MRTPAAFLIGLVAACAGMPAAATPTEVVRQLASGFVIPRFQTVAAAAHAQAEAWSGFCANRTQADVGVLRAAYDKVGDAWAAVEFVRMGPGAAELRAERLDYWLDRQNAGGRALNALLATDAPQSLEPATLAAGSAAGQGLPIIERLIYDGGDQALKAPGADGDRRCAVGTAVARNVASLADAILEGWTGPGGAGPAIAANAQWKTSFADSNEAARVLLTDLFSAAEGLKDFKLAMMFHDEANAGAARLAQDARSDRTLRDITLNLAGIREAMEAYFAPAGPAQKAQLKGLLDEVQARLQDVQAAQDHTPSHSPERLKAIQAALTAFETLQQASLPLLPAATGVNLGFNNLDGD